MIDFCMMTVKGDGVGKYGKPKKDVTMTVTEFLVDNGVYYAAVYQHLRGCEASPRCDPQQVLEAYLARRTKAPKNPKVPFSELGMTSKGLAQLASKYLRAFPAVRKETAHEIIARSGDLESILKSADGMSRPFLVMGLNMAFKWRQTERGKALRTVRSTILGVLEEKPWARVALACGALWDAGINAEIGSLTDGELDDLLKVTEVMTL